MLKQIKFMLLKISTLLIKKKYIKPLFVISVFKGIFTCFLIGAIGCPAGRMLHVNMSLYLKWVYHSSQMSNNFSIT